TSLRRGSGSSMRGGSEIPGDARAGRHDELRGLTTFLTISPTTDGFDASMTADRSGPLLTIPHRWVVTLEDGSPHRADQSSSSPPVGARQRPPGPWHHSIQAGPRKPNV